MTTEKLISNEEWTSIPTDSGIKITRNNEHSDESMIDFNIELNNIKGQTQIDMSANMIDSLKKR